MHTAAFVPVLKALSVVFHLIQRLHLTQLLSQLAIAIIQLPTAVQLHRLQSGENSVPSGTDSITMAEGNDI